MSKSLDEIMRINGCDPFHYLGRGGLGYKPTKHTMIGGVIEFQQTGDDKYEVNINLDEPTTKEQIEQYEPLWVNKPISFKKRKMEQIYKEVKNWKKWEKLEKL